MSTTPPGRGEGIRTARAVLLLGATVVVGLLLLHHVGGPGTAPLATTSSPRATPTTTTVPSRSSPTTSTTTIPPIPPSQVKLLVLNGTGSGDLAGKTGRALAASAGYDTLAADNTTATVTASMIYAIDPRYVTAADALAARLDLPVTDVATPVPATAPVRASERGLADVVLIIGPGFTVPSATPVGPTAASVTTSTTS